MREVTVDGSRGARGRHFISPRIEHPNSTPAFIIPEHGDGMLVGDSVGQAFGGVVLADGKMTTPAAAAFPRTTGFSINVLISRPSSAPSWLRSH